MIRNTTKNQKIFWVLFILYLIALIYFMFFAESFGRSNVQSEYAYNLELFREIRRFYTYREQLGWKAVVLNLGGNVAGFMPFGFILPIISRRGKKWYNILFLSFFFSLGIETVQLIWKVGSFDVDDLLLNTIGGILGFVGYCVVQQVRKRRRLGDRKK